jgi:hypothetical protein
MLACYAYYDECVARVQCRVNSITAPAAAAGSMKLWRGTFIEMDSSLDKSQISRTATEKTNELRWIRDRFIIDHRE